MTQSANMIRVALDTMGADGGVAPIVAGAARVSREEENIHVTLVGNRAAIEEALAAQEHDRSRIAIEHAPDTINMADKPKVALAANPRCSILRAAQLVKAGDAQVLVSAGNTGAVILAASQTFERLPGVRRVGLAAVHPTVSTHGPHADPFALILDVGATLSCTAEDLVAFAVMGGCYSRIISETERPRVALLSNGTEATKGLPAIVQAHAHLEKIEGIEFVGNVEGLDIPRGTADVVVCEGFVGNIVLKMLEGVSEVVKELAKAAYGSKLRYKIGLGMLSGGIRKLKKLTDWKQYGGAPIVGFDHLVIKAHGRSNDRAIRNALKVAAKTVDRDLSQQIRHSLK